MDLKKIGKFIFELRKENNLTQESLANILIVDRGTISKWERGVYLPNPEMLLKLQEIFGVSVNEILCGERKDKEDEKNINNIVIETKTKNNIRKLVFRTTVFITTFLIIFLSYYFINNYSSTKVYKITGENEGYTMSDGLAVVSHENTYFKLGQLSYGIDSNKEIYKTRLFYLKNNEEKLIYDGELGNIDFLYMNKCGNEEKDFIKNLYLRVTFEDDETLDIKLKFQKLYSNDKLIH